MQSIVTKSVNVQPIAVKAATMQTIAMKSVNMHEISQYAIKSVTVQLNRRPQILVDLRAEEVIGHD